MSVMQSMLSKMLSMIPDEQLNSSIEMLTKQLIEYKNQFEILPENNEETIIIALFEDKKQLFAAVCATDSENKIVRQITTVLVNELLQSMLKTALKNA